MRIAVTANAVTVFEIGLFLFAVSVVLFACLVQQYIYQPNDALENVQLHAVANKDKINFTGTFDRQIYANATFRITFYKL